MRSRSAAGLGVAVAVAAALLLAGAAAEQPDRRTARLPACATAPERLVLANGSSVSLRGVAALDGEEGAAGTGGRPAACQRVRVRSTDGRSHYVRLDVNASWTAAGGEEAEEAETLWRHTAHFARNERGFRPTLQRTAFVREARAEFSWTLMLPSSEDKVAFLMVECALPNEHCAQLRGRLEVNHTVTVLEDRCNAHRNDTSRCERCAVVPGCGWCDEATEFAGCWQGGAAGPEYDNDDSRPCGEVSARRLPHGETPDSETYHRWVYQGGGGGGVDGDGSGGDGDGAVPPECHHRPSNDGYVLLTGLVVFLFGGAILCTVGYHALRSFGVSLPCDLTAPQQAGYAGVRQYEDDREDGSSLLGGPSPAAAARASAALDEFDDLPDEYD